MAISGTAGPYGSSTLFFRNLHTVFCNGYTSPHSHQEYTGLPFCHMLANTSLTGRRWHLAWFSSALPWWYWALFHVSAGNSYVFIWKMSIHVLCPFFNQVICFLMIELFQFYIYFGSNSVKITAKNTLKVVLHICDPSTQEAEAGWLRF
jgi:hypothetical protein